MSKDSRLRFLIIPIRAAQLGVVLTALTAAASEPSRSLHEVSPPGGEIELEGGLVLSGVLVAPGLREAMFTQRGNPPAGGTLRLREGDPIGAGVIKRIEKDGVIVEQHGIEQRLNLAADQSTGHAIPRAPKIIPSADPRLPGIASRLPPVLDY